MYQFYYSDPVEKGIPDYRMKISEVFSVSAIRPTMWEEHCLECSAPLCFRNCRQYIPRSDGRCKRFYNDIEVRPEERGCCGQAARVRFRRWGNLMTIIFPNMLSCSSYNRITSRNQALGRKLRAFNRLPFPTIVRWEGIRAVEYMRRNMLRLMRGKELEPDAFLFHGYSFEGRAFRLIIEIYQESRPVYKTSIELKPGENLHILNKGDLSPECWRANNLIKVYPEDNIEAEIEILWCDFVQGKAVKEASKADKIKCVVWDLDNTLWGGILIESEPEQLSLRPDVERVIRALDERGIIQSVASKNDYEAAWPVLERLGVSEFFLYPQINWEAKSASIRTIARCLNIGVDTFAMVDDSVFERNQIQDALPAVRCYRETEIPAMLTYPEFSVVVTDESKNRRAMYRAEEKRNHMMREENSDTITFLRKCNLRACLFEPTEKEELLRCFELVNRTNQLNMTGRKYSDNEFEIMLRREGAHDIAFSCEDDFGKYGIVGFGQYRIENNTLVMTEFAMSCRVAGKFVESALFSHLLVKSGCAVGTLSIVKTKKNQLLRRTLLEIGFSVDREDNDQLVCVFTDSLLHKDLVKVEDQR